MAVLMIVLVFVFVGLLAYGHSTLDRHVGSEVAHATLAISVATVIGCLLAVAFYTESS